MIRVVESKLHDQTVTAVLDTGRSPPNILSIHKGKYSNHDFKCASYHASRHDQEEIPVVRRNGQKDTAMVEHNLT